MTDKAAISKQLNHKIPESLIAEFNAKAVREPERTRAAVLERILREYVQEEGQSTIETKGVARTYRDYGFEGFVPDYMNMSYQDVLRQSSDILLVLPNVSQFFHRFDHLDALMLRASFGGCRTIIIRNADALDSNTKGDSAERDIWIMGELSKIEGYASTQGLKVFKTPPTSHGPFPYFMLLTDTDVIVSHDLTAKHVAPYGMRWTGFENGHPYTPFFFARRLMLDLVRDYLPQSVKK